MRRLVVDLEPRVGQRQSVDRLSGAGHRLRAGANQRGEIGAFKARPSAGKRDRRGALVAGDRDRQGAVGRDSQAKVEAIQFETPDLHAPEEEGGHVEPDLAGRGRHDGAPGGVANRQTAEAEAHAQRIVHEIGRAEIDRVAVADALLQARGDLVVQRLKIDRPVRKARGERDNGKKRQDRRGFGHARCDVAEPSAPGAPHAGGKARTGGAVAHAAHR